MYEYALFWLKTDVCVVSFIFLLLNPGSLREKNAMFFFFFDVLRVFRLAAKSKKNKLSQVVKLNNNFKKRLCSSACKQAFEFSECARAPWCSAEVKFG